MRTEKIFETRRKALYFLGFLTPNIQLHSVFLDFDELKDALKTGSVDGIITVEDSLQHMDQAELNSQVLSESQQILLYAQNHPLADRDDLTPFDFRGENFLVVRNKDLNSEKLVQQYCAIYGFSPQLTLVPNADSLIAGGTESCRSRYCRWAFAGAP